MIKNIVFDIGNVLIKWQPAEIMAEFFPNNPEMLYDIFKSDVWYNLNLGVLTKEEAIELYNKRTGLESELLQKLWDSVLESLVPIDDTVKILEQLHRARTPLYSITDNIREIFEYVRSRYMFPSLFIDVVTSYDVCALKPSPKIYQHLLQRNNLKAEECVFIDDILTNVEGAKKVGMQGIHFIDAKSCREELVKLGVMM